MFGSEAAGSRSHDDAERQQLLGVHVVERPQVGQLQQQLGEAGRVQVEQVVLGADGRLVDQQAQSSDQVLLELLHRRHVLDARPV